MGLCLQAPSGFAQDQDQKQKDKKEAKTSSRASEAKPQVAKHERGDGGVSRAGKGSTEVARKVQKGTQKDVASRGEKSQGKLSASNTAGAYRSTNAVTQNTGMSSRSIQQTGRRQSQQTQASAVAVQGNRSNHYNNQWVAGNTHSDWGRNGYHQWNNHDYRWYDGGWLIIDTGYYQTGSIVREVKESLAQDGYYNGHINDQIGPRTRQAIANYEGDNDLPGNGSINEPLLVSLRIE